MLVTMKQRLNLIRAAIIAGSKKHGSLRNFAAYLNVSHTLLSLVKNGHQVCSTDLARRLGFEKRSVYQPINKRVEK